MQGCHMEAMINVWEEKLSQLVVISFEFLPNATLKANILICLVILKIADSWRDTWKDVVTAS